MLCGVPVWSPDGEVCHYIAYRFFPFSFIIQICYQERGGALLTCENHITYIEISKEFVVILE